MKNNGNFTVCLTHDVDRVKKTYQYITHFIKTQKIYHLKSIFQKTNPYWQFEKLMRIEEGLGVKSTFFFLNESIGFNPLNPKNIKLSIGRYDINDEKVKKIIRKLDGRGWEIGVHGSYNSYKNIELLKKEKHELEKILAHKVHGIRQHYINLNPKTWKIQAEAGFRYDSSFGFNNGKIGFMENKLYPFHPLKNRKNFLVIPMTIMDWCMMKNNKKKYIELIDIAEKNGGVLTLNWHQRKFNELEFKNYSKIYIEIIKECKNRNAFIGTCKDIYNLKWK